MMKYETCEYSGLPNIVSYETDGKAKYISLLQSGLFWELFPQLTGEWEKDKSKWVELQEMK